jgi:hypothetical protein
MVWTFMVVPFLRRIILLWDCGQESNQAIDQLRLDNHPIDLGPLQTLHHRSFQDRPGLELYLDGKVTATQRSIDLGKAYFRRDAAS